MGDLAARIKDVEAAVKIADFKVEAATKVGNWEMASKWMAKVCQLRDKEHQLLEKKLVTLRASVNALEEDGAQRLPAGARNQDIRKGMLVHEALEAVGAIGANLELVLDALKTCDFAPTMPADASFTHFDASQHLEHLSPHLQGYILAAQREAARQVNMREEEGAQSTPCKRKRSDASAREEAAEEALLCKERDELFTQLQAVLTADPSSAGLAAIFPGALPLCMSHDQLQQALEMYVDPALLPSDISAFAALVRRRLLAAASLSRDPLRPQHNFSSIPTHLPMVERSEQTVATLKNILTWEEKQTADVPERCTNLHTSAHLRGQGKSCWAQSLACANLEDLRKLAKSVKGSARLPHFPKVLACVSIWVHVNKLDTRRHSSYIYPVQEALATWLWGGFCRFCECHRIPVNRARMFPDTLAVIRAVRETMGDPNANGGIQLHLDRAEAIICKGEWFKHKLKPSPEPTNATERQIEMRKSNSEVLNSLYCLWQEMQPSVSLPGSTHLSHLLSKQYLSAELKQHHSPSAGGAFVIGLNALTLAGIAEVLMETVCLNANGSAPQDAKCLGKALGFKEGDMQLKADWHCEGAEKCGSAIQAGCDACTPSTDSSSTGSFQAGIESSSDLASVPWSGLPAGRAQWQQLLSLISWLTRGIPLLLRHTLVTLMRLAEEEGPHFWPSICSDRMRRLFVGSNSLLQCALRSKDYNTGTSAWETKYMDPTEARHLFIHAVLGIPLDDSWFNDLGKTWAHAEIPTNVWPDSSMQNVKSPKAHHDGSASWQLVPMLPPHVLSTLDPQCGRPGQYLRSALQHAPELASPGQAAEVCVRASVLDGLILGLKDQTQLSAALPFLSGHDLGDLPVSNCNFKDIPGDIFVPILRNELWLDVSGLRSNPKRAFSNPPTAEEAWQIEKEPWGTLLAPCEVDLQIQCLGDADVGVPHPQSWGAELFVQAGHLHHRTLLPIHVKFRGLESSISLEDIQREINRTSKQAETWLKVGSAVTDYAGSLLWVVFFAVAHINMPSLPELALNHVL
ncbi:hypothetical protein WJX74_002530 [Apatococcus lobatus]|uniref:Uncharacterized protein n=1 Tax=Apatococcus lobatus TaxID=904363 RepID=A0AAW1Q4X3_9CHLO